MKQQKINRPKSNNGPIVYDQRPPKQVEALDLSKANGPVRAVNFVEVGDMVGKQIQLILQQLNSTHDTAKGGIHYFLPIRHGKIGSDVVFEEEFERVAENIFEVVDDNGNIIQNCKIRLKGGAKEVTVVRQKI